MKINLRTCKKGDILISSQRSTLEYICPTPLGHFVYLDHVVRYVKDKNGKDMKDDSFGTRTHDGYVFNKSRIPETDEDIIEIRPLKSLKNEK